MTSTTTPRTLELRWFDPCGEKGEAWLAEWARVHAAAERHAHGDGATPWTTQELRAFAAPNNAREHHFVVALLGEEVVGAGRVGVSLKDNADLAALILQVHPAHRRHGVGSALAAATEDRGRSLGRRIFLVETQWRVGRDDLDGAFARQHGYAEAQTVLRSALSLPVDTGLLTGLCEGSGRADAADYVLETAWDGVPEPWLEDRAELARRMSTDIPLGDLALTEEHWDGARVRAEEQRLRQGGRRFVESAAREVSSGRLVGYTAYSVSASTPHLALQGDTLVIQEHRGHGLGARMKAANTLALRDELPAVAVLRTWNAQENEPMLAVNRALGFEVDGYEREWQKTLA